MFKDFTSFLDTQRAGSPQPDPAFRYAYYMMDVSPDEEVFHFQFEADPCLYDSGKKISVAYRRNKNEVDCVENTILDYKPEPMRKEMGALDALLQVYPDFPTRATSFYDTATRITIETIGGKLTATITEDLDAIIPYPPIPSSLSHVPTVSITEIQRMRTVYMDVDCVKWRGSTYAFKQTGEEVEGTLRELVILDRLAKSPNIINVAAIVVNHDNAIRGFLTPFMCTGDLESVFEKARQSIGLGDNDDATAFEWPLKLSWARQIAQAVVELHAISAYNGDLKPQNILISPTGRALLIDFLPRGISDDFAAPELVEMSHSHGIPFELVVSAPADVYSLGLVLWAVAEERWGGIRTPVWRDGKTPDWYRDIVKRCLVLAPEARPSAIEVLSLLERERA